MSRAPKKSVYFIAAILSVFSFLNYLNLEFGFGGLGKEMALLSVFIHLFLPPLALFFCIRALLKWREEENNALSLLVVFFCLLNIFLILKTILFVTDSSNFNIM